MIDIHTQPLDYFRKAAKRLLRQFKDGDAEVVARARAVYEDGELTLMRSQHLIALGYDFKDWDELLQAPPVTLRVRILIAEEQRISMRGVVISQPAPAPGVDEGLPATSLRIRSTRQDCFAHRNSDMVAPWNGTREQINSWARWWLVDTSSTVREVAEWILDNVDPDPILSFDYHVEAWENHIKSAFDAESRIHFGHIWAAFAICHFPYAVVDSMAVSSSGGTVRLGVNEFSRMHIDAFLAQHEQGKIRSFARFVRLASVHGASPKSPEGRPLVWKREERRCTLEIETFTKPCLVRLYRERGTPEERHVTLHPREADEVTEEELRSGFAEANAAFPIAEWVINGWDAGEPPPFVVADRGSNVISAARSVWSAKAWRAYERIGASRQKWVHVG